MPLYAAVIYTEDLDWTAPEQAEETKEYAEFGESAAKVIRGGAGQWRPA